MIISKNKALRILEKDGYIIFGSITAKVSIFDKNSKYIGDLQYRTYKNFNLYEVKTKNSYGLYEYRKFLRKENDKK